MTDNQEKELFNTLSTLVTGVQTIQTEVKTIKTEIREIKETQNEHSRILRRLDAKTDSIVETVITNDKRLTAVEKDVSSLRGGIR